MKSSTWSPLAAMSIKSQVLANIQDELEENYDCLALKWEVDPDTFRKKLYALEDWQWAEVHVMVQAWWDMSRA
jgi:hypothetical protein